MLSPTLLLACLADNWCYKMLGFLPSLYHWVPHPAAGTLFWVIKCSHFTLENPAGCCGWYPSSTQLLRLCYFWCRSTATIDSDNSMNGTNLLSSPKSKRSRKLVLLPTRTATIFTSNREGTKAGVNSLFQICSTASQGLQLKMFVLFHHFPDGKCRPPFLDKHLICYKLLGDVFFLLP